MSIRTDVLVTGPIQTESIFALGGFVSPIGKGIQWTTNYSLYLRKDEEVVLCEGWKTALDYPELPFKMIYFSWKTILDTKNSIRRGIRLPFILEVYDETKTRIEGVYLGYDPLKQRLFLGKLTDTNLDFIFDLSQSLHDWNDGSFSLQAWNVMIRDSNTIIPYIKGDGKQNGFVTGYASSSICSIMNFIPIPLEWTTKNTILPFPKSSLELQQCYRYAQTGNDICNIGSYNNYKGITDSTIAQNVSYLPYFISNLGCGSDPVTTIPDTLGKPIVASTGYGTGGICVRNVNLDLQIKGSVPPTTPVVPIPQSPCRDCNPINYPEAFKKYCQQCPDNSANNNTSNTNMTSSIWFWVLIGIFTFLVLILIVYLIYYVNRSKKCNKEKDTTSSLKDNKRSFSAKKTEEKPTNVKKYTYQNELAPQTQSSSLIYSPPVQENDDTKLEHVSYNLPIDSSKRSNLLYTDLPVQSSSISKMNPGVIESYEIASHPPPAHIGTLHHYKTTNVEPIYEYDLTTRPIPEYSKVPPVRYSSQ